MNSLLRLCLSLSFSGSLVAAALILLRPLLRRFGRTWQYYLWLLVILRLLLPFSPDPNIAGRIFFKAESYLTAGSAPTADRTESRPSALPAAAPKPPPSPPSAAFLENHLMGAFWLAAAIVLFLRKVRGYRQLVKTVRGGSTIISGKEQQAALQMVCSSMGIKNKISISENPLVRAPMLIGLLHPMVVLPAGTIPAAELGYIIRHELTHYRRMDLLYKWLAEIAVCLHWFNPLAYWVRKQINRDCEFACDEAVAANLSYEQRHTYGDTLLNSIDSTLRGKSVVSLSLSPDGRFLKERLCAIMKYKPKSKLTLLTASILTGVLLCVTVFAGAYPAAAAENINTDARRSHTLDGRDAALRNSPGTVVYDSVELLQYEGESGHPYIHEIKTNGSSRKIVGCRQGMLAFDKYGNPLKIDWMSLDSELESEYFHLYEEDSAAIGPGETYDVPGGWSLNIMGLDPEAANIAYVLYCDKEITFEDGSVWENPDFADWRSAYEGKKTDVQTLENYYPYEQKTGF